MLGVIMCIRSSSRSCPNREAAPLKPVGTMNLELLYVSDNECTDFFRHTEARSAQFSEMKVLQERSIKFLQEVKKIQRHEGMFWNTGAGSKGGLVGRAESQRSGSDGMKRYGVSNLLAGKRMVVIDGDSVAA